MKIGTKHSEGTKEKMSFIRFNNPVKYWLGKRMSGEHKNKIKNNHPDFSGENNPMYGRKQSWRHRQSIKRGSDSNFWRGGISNYQYPNDWTDDLRKNVRKRDNYVCQLCGIHQDELNTKRAKKLDCHHIDYSKDNLGPSNLISLCRGCHIETNSNREYWQKYFNNL